LQRLNILAAPLYAYSLIERNRATAPATLVVFSLQDASLSTEKGYICYNCEQFYERIQFVRSINLEDFDSICI